MESKETGNNAQNPSDKPKSKFGRKKLSDNEKMIQFSIKLPITLIKRVKSLSKANGHDNVSEFRRAIYESVLNNKKYQAKTDTKAILNINKIGNNINQITKKINSNPDLNTYEVTKYLEDIKANISYLTNIIKGN